MSAPATPSPTATSGSDAAGSASDPGHSSCGAAAEVCGQLRPFRDGPNPPATHSDSNEADVPSPAARLHRHALESIFAFLGPRELAFALRVARGWLAAAQSMRRLELKIRRQPSSALGVVARSAMGRHVGAFESLHLNAASSAVLSARMAHLRALHCYLAMPPLAGLLAFPAALRTLNINLSGPADAARINAAIAAIGRLPLLEELTIRLDEIDPQFSFAPLAAQSLLRRLDVSWPKGGPLSDAQIDHLRALPWLQEFNVPMTALLLRRLLRQPHDLQWRQISLPDWLSDEAAALLPLLPSLVSLLARPTCSSFDWLSGLPNLTNLRLTFFSAANAAGRGALLAAGLPRCPTVEILTIDNCADLTAGQLADLLPRLPRLRKLGLSRLPVGSLAFLAQPPLTDQLRGLRLNSCRRLPPDELRHVHSLRGLTKLELNNSFTAPLDDHDRALLTPPSAHLPLLEEFVYRVPPAAAMPPDPVAAVQLSQ